MLEVENFSQIKERYKKRIFEYLADRSIWDAEVRNGCRSENKDFTGLFEFIRSKARAKAQDNCAVILAEDVYKWATEYVKTPNTDPKVQETLEQQMQEFYSNFGVSED